MVPTDFSHLVDRLGAPMALVLLFGWLCYHAIRGPGMELARALGGGFGDLCKAGVTYLGAATQKLEALPAHVSLEAASVRDVVKTEHATTREHVTDAVAALRDQVQRAASAPQKEAHA
jgi:hypothetical protein